MPPPSYMRQGLTPVDSGAGLISRRNKFDNHRYENRLTNIDPHFRFDGDIMNPHGRRHSHGSKLQSNGAGLSSSAQSHGQGSAAMGGIIQQDAVNQARVAD